MTTRETENSRTRLAALMVSLLLLAVIRFALAGDQGMKTIKQKTPAEFEKIKQLAGTWSGTENMGGKMTDYTVSYEVTAGGSAVLEREFAGTPQKMVSVYYPEGNRVAVTHYCMLGNQPHLILKKISGNAFFFEMQGTSGIKSPKEVHMHSLKLTLVDANHIRLDWSEYANGKKSQVHVMELTRKS